MSRFLCSHGRNEWRCELACAINICTGNRWRCEEGEKQDRSRQVGGIDSVIVGRAKKLLLRIEGGVRLECLDGRRGVLAGQGVRFFGGSNWW